MCCGEINSPEPGDEKADKRGVLSPIGPNGETIPDDPNDSKKSDGDWRTTNLNGQCVIQIYCSGQWMWAYYVNTQVLQLLCGCPKTNPPQRYNFVCNGRFFLIPCQQT